jgi:glycosyltransferase involved in cell wall biosynthesis
MNILFLTRRFYPDIGGVETHVLRVVEELIRQGHTVTVVAEQVTGKSENDTEEASLKWQNRYISDKMTGRVKQIYNSGQTTHGSVKSSTFGGNSSVVEKNTKADPYLSKIIIYHLPKVKEDRTKKLIIWKWLFQHRKLIKDADVVHCHDVFFWYMPFRFLYLTKKVFITFHGYEGVFPPAKKAILIRKLSEWLAHGNICVGDYIKKWYGTRPDFVTYGGVDSRKWKMENGKWKKTPPLSIVFVGRIAEDTGVLVYAKALEQLRLKKVNFSFEVAGDGPLRDEFEKYGTVHGFVPGPEGYMQKADIVFASSYLSILQALSFSKLVMSVYGNPLKEDYLRMAPFSKGVEILSDPKDIINIIDRYQTDKANFANKVKIGHEWAYQQTWENLANIYLQLWNMNKRGIGKTS